MKTITAVTLALAISAMPALATTPGGTPKKPACENTDTRPMCPPSQCGDDGCGIFKLHSLSAYAYHVPLQ